MKICAIQMTPNDDYYAYPEAVCFLACPDHENIEAAINEFKGFWEVSGDPDQSPEDLIWFGDVVRRGKESGRGWSYGYAKALQQFLEERYCMKVLQTTNVIVESDNKWHSVTKKCPECQREGHETKVERLTLNIKVESQL